MLMIMCIDTWMHLCSPAIGVFTRCHGVCVQNTTEFYLELYRRILVEAPVHTVLVVRNSKNLRNNKLPASCNDHGVVAEVSMFKEDA